MSEKKKIGNVAVRLPEGYRLAMTDDGRRPLTPEVEFLLLVHLRKLPKITLTAAPEGVDRAFLSIRADLADRLREVARERCTTAGVLLYSLIRNSIEPVEASSPSRRKRTHSTIEHLAA